MQASKCLPPGRNRSIEYHWRCVIHVPLRDCYIAYPAPWSSVSLLANIPLIRSKQERANPASIIRNDGNAGVVLIKRSVTALRDSLGQKTYLERCITVQGSDLNSSLPGDCAIAVFRNKVVNQMSVRLGGWPRERPLIKIPPSQ